MPATEQTWRSQTLMHVVFGISSLVLLVATLWMFVADHNREWKRTQRKFRRVETWATQARIAEQKAGDYEAKEKELAEAISEARSTPPDKGLVDQFVGVVQAHDERFDPQPIEDAYQQLSEKPSESTYAGLMTELQGVVKEATRQEKNAARDMKFKRADLDVARSDYDRGVGEGASEARLVELEAKTRAIEEQVDELTKAAQEGKTYRTSLEQVLASISAPETAAKQARENHEAEIKRLAGAEQESYLSPMEQLLSMPILDAFGHPEKVDQIWLPKLTINNNFRDVARFDRCTTCHQAMEKTAPGSATLPAYPHEQLIPLKLATPAEAPKWEGEDATLSATAQIEKLYGLRLAKDAVEPTDAAIEIVWPNSLAAQAGLQAGDVLQAIGDVALTKQERKINQQLAQRFLLDTVKWGQPIEITARRGAAHPFSSHPRLDLFVGPMSPHKMADIGCTVCHDGQGSATDFRYASHTPNTPQQETNWAKDHGWYQNHHWIFPMYPKRFAESTCLKCHHDVTELEPSERFPDPPAEKLVRGYHLIRRYGCFGCHEINGFNGPSKRVGPDLRTEPMIFGAAQQLLADPNLAADAKELATAVAAHPENESDRRLLAEKIRAAAAEAPNPTALKMADIVGADYETPGKQRKVGPSLRHVASKVDYQFLYNWLSNPLDFRPDTRMPRFFGLWEHLVDENGEKPLGRGDAERFEAVEIHAATHYLLTSSQPFEYLQPPKEVSASASAERGKRVFELRGCLACHSHKDFPAGKADQGPDLSQMGGKLAGENGRRWLYSWVKEPNRYHARTVMPDLFLDPADDGQGTLTDPAADVTEYLLGSQGWKPQPTPQINEEDLDALTLEHLKNTFTVRQANEYLKKGIPAARAGELKGDEVVLVGEINRDKKLAYVGRRTISKLGCAGCHDIPGYEDAKPIGTALADWGRKDPAKLAFEQIGRFMQITHGTGQTHAAEHAAADAEHGTEAHGRGAHGAAEHGTGAQGHLEVRNLDPDTGYFMQALLEHRREGFIWQKLRQPRSYDYMKTENKTYNERLRMPQFPLEHDDIEAIMTFVLGLVAEPPATQYVYSPSPKQRAIVEGRQVLDRFNCGGCHQLELEKWAIEYDPTKFSDPPAVEDFPITLPHFTPKQVEDSKKVDRRGLGTAHVLGQPLVDAKGQLVEAEDDDGNPAVLFSPWRAALVNGQAWLPGVADLVLSQTQIKKKTAPVGGDLARLIYPSVLVEERAANPNVKDGDAWGWVPPPLIGEGRKVQTAWLHDFLLDPYAIRPAVVLRMPKFNMSSAEASKLVNYFAAKDDVEYPYAFDARSRASHLASAEAGHPQRLDHAMKLVTNRNFCVQCHKVGDFVPTGSVKAQAPNLDRVFERLRPEFVRGWIANPKRYLPYTGMPVNFPYGKEVAQDVFAGDSQAQIDGVTDLLLNFPHFMQKKTSVAEMVPPPAAGAEGAAAGEPAASTVAPAEGAGGN